MDTEKPADSIQPKTAIVSAQQITTVDMFDQGRAKGALLLADRIATSSIIPEHYQMRPDNVLVALYRSARLGMDVFAYMETTYPVNGRLGHEAKFVTSLINNSGKFKTPLLYEMSGEIIRNPDGTLSEKSTRKCKAWAVLKDVNEKISQEVDMEMAFREGWATRPGRDKTLKTNKWQTMPDVMLQYRSAKFFGNMYCPELVMGLNTRDELEDISDAEVIEETQEGRDIFEKGEPVDTAADPVLDPAMEVKNQAATHAENNPEPSTIPANPDPHAGNAREEQPATDNASPAPAATDESLNNKPTLPDEPPENIGEFKLWFLSKFACEMHTIEVFLLNKKWLPMGGSINDLSDKLYASLRSQWDKFKSKYDDFKKSRTR